MQEYTTRVQHMPALRQFSHATGAGFKSLPDMERVISPGGWAASTKQPKTGILQRTIIDKRDNLRPTWLISSKTRVSTASI